tara:strand:- start:545 stop:2215 length:1671 start_codon:yes stop_codon:yes gene_type:complete
MKKYIYSIILFSIFSCKKPLDFSPKYGFNAEVIYSNPDEYINVLSKLYSGLSMTGIQGPAGQADISTETIDEGFSSYVRVLWNLQELPTDEAVCGWNDPGIPALNKMQWSAEDGWIKGMYYRIYYQITLCNEFIYQSAQGKLSDRNFSQEDIDRINTYRNEARFLRALSYYHALDFFGSIPFVTEEDRVGAFNPPQINRENLFNYLESELIDLIDILSDASSLPYGRASKQAVQTLLAKLYLNAEVYINALKYAECRSQCESIVNSNIFQLESSYQHLFLADNYKSNEIIFPVVFDGLYAQTWGGTTFLVCASIGGDMSASDYGVNGGWGGLRVTEKLVNNFDYTKSYIYIDTSIVPNDTMTMNTVSSDTSYVFLDSSYNSDDERFLFFTKGQKLSITNLGNFRHGLALPKFKNINRDGTSGSNNANTSHVDIDFPMFRLADVYLMLAESALRLGDQGTALQYVNLIRERAYGNQSHNLGSITFDDILDERSRELAWEATRRTDLIRYDYFTSSNYLWPLKGGDPEGTGVDSHLDLYPIPTADLLLNDNLTQNDGY